LSTVGRRIVGGRRGQADEVDACGLGRVAQFAVVLGRQVDHDQAVDAGFLGVGDKRGTPYLWIGLK
jgi:hypothetical protein